jgi:hypothetical protein
MHSCAASANVIACSSVLLQWALFGSVMDTSSQLKQLQVPCHAVCC